MTAQWAVVQTVCIMRDDPTLERELRETVDAFARNGGRPRTRAAELAGRAQLALLERDVAALIAFRTTLRFDADYESARTAEGERLRPILDAYERVPMVYGVPSLVIAALARSGAVLERVAGWEDEEDPALFECLRRRAHPAAPCPPDHVCCGDTVRPGDHGRRTRCKAVAGYVAALRLARFEAIENDEVRFVRARLATKRVEEIRRFVWQEDDSSLENIQHPFDSHELDPP